MHHKNKVSHRLLKGFTADEALAFEASYVRARKVLAKINDYATKQVKEKTYAMEDPKFFDSANWQYLVSWWAGYRTAMRITQDLTRIK